MPKLLLVDDDESTRLICRRFFRRHGEIEILEAVNGEEALAVLASTRVDCVLSDYRMGVVTGLDVLERALDAQPHARRILMSGFADPFLHRAADERAKVHEFFEKPVSMPDFETLLERRVMPLLRAPA